MSDAADEGDEGVVSIVPLIEPAKRMMMLLHAADTFPRGGLYEGLYAENAVRRYEKLWLPLLAHATAKHADKLIPPVDVAFVWLCHRLNPQGYIEYCTREYGRVLDPNLQHAFAFTDGNSKNKNGRFTMFWWRGQYLLEPFMPGSQLWTQAAVSLWKPKSGLCLQLLASVKRQSTFTLQILRACYLQDPFLEQAQVRYCRFLQMAGEFNSVVPLIDIDLMWHTHMGLSGAYREDCQRLLGRVLRHDETIGEDRSPTSPLITSFAVTKSNYRAKYNELYVVPGSQYMEPKHAANHPAAVMLRSAVVNYYGREWRAGAHALYLLWLYRKGRISAVKVFQRMKEPDCCGPRPMFMYDIDYARRQRWQAVRFLQSQADSFAQFRNLPLDHEHPYFYTFLNGRLDQPRAPAGTRPTQDNTLCVMNSLNSTLSPQSSTGLAYPLVNATPSAHDIDLDEEYVGAPYTHEDMRAGGCLAYVDQDNKETWPNGEAAACAAGGCGANSYGSFGPVEKIEFAGPPEMARHMKAELEARRLAKSLRRKPTAYSDDLPADSERQVLGKNGSRGSGGTGSLRAAGSLGASRTVDASTGQPAPPEPRALQQQRVVPADSDSGQPWVREQLHIKDPGGGPIVVTAADVDASGKAQLWSGMSFRIPVLSSSADNTDDESHIQQTSSDERGTGTRVAAHIARIQKRQERSESQQQRRQARAAQMNPPADSAPQHVSLGQASGSGEIWVADDSLYQPRFTPDGRPSGKHFGAAEAARAINSQISSMNDDPPSPAAPRR